MEERNLSEKPPVAYSYLRLSTKAQLKGDGKRRQLERTRKYARENGLRLDRKLQLDDVGKSAYTGANLREGALGKFLEKVKAGQIPRGSVLIVESLDRISRLNVLDALAVFTDILKGGIDIVTLIDGHKYQAKNTTPTDLIISVIAFARSNEESATKADRLRKAWEEKRQKGARKKITSHCPAWLQLSRNRFEVIQERANIVREIFSLCADGSGSLAITRLFADRGVRPFNESDGWQTSYITKILRNRAVIGEFQPHRIEDNGKRIPAGEPLRDYFPKIVDNDLFYKVQKVRAVRNVSGRGRNGKYLSNLFKGLLVCEMCGGHIKFENKGPPPKGGYYLVCERATRNLDCESALWGRWKYKEFEKSFLTFVREVNFKETKFSRPGNEELGELQDTIDSSAGERHVIETRMSRITAAIEMGNGPLPYLVDQLESLTAEHFKILEREKNAILKSSELKSQTLTLSEDTDELKKLILKLLSSTSDDVTLLRTKITADLRLTVDLISVHGLFKTFKVFFKDGSVRGIEPTTADAFSASEYYVSNDGLMTKRGLDRITHFFAPVAVPLSLWEQNVFGMETNLKWDWKEFTEDKIQAALKAYKTKKNRDPRILALENEDEDDIRSLRRDRKRKTRSTKTKKIRLRPRQATI